jgi:hypothetical protein
MYWQKELCIGLLLPESMFDALYTNGLLSVKIQRLIDAIESEPDLNQN